MPGGCFPTTTSIRITSLRANASQLGLPAQAGFPSTQVTAFLSVGGDAPFPVTNNVLNVGVPLLGLLPEVNGPVSGTQCEAIEQIASVKLLEGFATAFKTEGAASVQPGNNIDEAGYPAPGSNGGDGATGPTRFLLRFRNIPAGVTIKTPEKVDQSPGAPSFSKLALTLVTGADENGAGGVLATGRDLQTVAITNGSGFAVYEVRDVNPSTIESLDIPVLVSWPNGVAAPGTGQIAIDYAPLSTVLQSSQAAPEPRFIDVNQFKTLLTVSACTTEPPPPAAVLSKVSGDNQVVPGGSPFPLPLVTRLTQAGQPLANRALTISVPAPGSQYVSCSPATTTDADGSAFISCVAAENNTGSSQFAAIHVSDGTVQLGSPFGATVQPQLMSLRLLSPATVRAAVNQTTPDAIRVKVETAAGPASNVSVYFVTPPGVHIEPSVRTTDSSGVASAPVRLGCISEGGRVDIGLSLATSQRSVRIEPLPAEFANLSVVQGNRQGGVPGERLPEALVVETADQCGNPIDGLAIAWSVQPANAASLEVTSNETTSRGRASTLARIGSHSGPFTISATIQGKTARFDLEAEAGPSGLVSLSGHSQRVPKSQAAPQPLVARVTDPQGNGFSGVRVNFRLLEGSGQLDPSSVLTGEDGRAATVFTAGLRLGPVRIEASAFEETAQFDLLVTGRKPVVEPAAVVDGAGFEIGLTAGGAGSIFGVNMMEDVNGVLVPAPNAVALSQDGSQQSAGLWPLEFEGVSIRINGLPAPLFALASMEGFQQINFQVPFDVASFSRASVEITNNGSTTTLSNIPILPAKPRIFEIPIDDKVYAAALHLDYSLVEPAAPARPGEIILLFLTGLGPTDPEVATNLLGPVPPAATVLQPTVRLAGAEQQVLGSFYAPQLTSVYQINLRINEDTAPGEQEIEALIEGVGGQKLLLPVGP